MRNSNASGCIHSPPSEYRVISDVYKLPVVLYKGYDEGYFYM